MSGKCLAFLLLVCLFSGSLFSLDTARSVEPPANGQMVPNVRGELPRGAMVLEINCWDQNEVKEFLIFAINQGVPLFNGGDHYGCYRIYDFAAKRIVWISGHCPHRFELVQAARALQMALEKAEAARTAKDKAWALRRAFDAIVERQAQ